MARRNRRWVCELRGPSILGKDAIRTYKLIAIGQPLILIREPDNPVDGNAVLVSDLIGVAFCYVDRDTAALIAPVMDAGTMLLAKVKTLPHLGKPFRYATATVWEDGLEEEITIREKENA